MNDVHTLTDDELNAARIDILTEIERRKNLAAIPEQITALRDQYTAAGGYPADLKTAGE